MTKTKALNPLRHVFDLFASSVFSLVELIKYLRFFYLVNRETQKQNINLQKDG
jgi:hypothetical protein